MGWLSSLKMRLKLFRANIILSLPLPVLKLFLLLCPGKGGRSEGTYGGGGFEGIEMSEIVCNRGEEGTCMKRNKKAKKVSLGYN
jgi:hypothetical protein